MTVYYYTQPDELPSTLPKGTLKTHGNYVADSTLRLDDGKYVGDWRNVLCGTVANGYLHPRSIDWSSVPIPAPEVPEYTLARCFLCDNSRSDILDQWRFVAKIADRHELGSSIFEMCRRCAQLPYEHVRDAIHARRRAAKDSSGSEGSSVGDNPSPTPGACSEGVATPDSSKEPAVGNVAKPQHETGGAPPRAPNEPDETSLEFCASCREGTDPRYLAREPCELAGNAKWYCPTCISEARERFGAPPLNLCSTPACSARGVVAKYSGVWCVYCRHRAHGELAGRRLSGSELAARQRVAAWERSEKPSRGNAADARAFALPHPWEEFE